MSICGGQHNSKEWTEAEIRHHIFFETCIDCYCGIPFKEKKEKKQ